jgi:hypothetical protein
MDDEKTPSPSINTVITCLGQKKNLPTLQNVVIVIIVPPPHPHAHTEREREDPMSEPGIAPVSVATCAGVPENKKAVAAAPR